MEQAIKLADIGKGFVNQNQLEGDIIVKEGKINIAFIDDAVKRILIKKFEMGLFDDPYKFSNNEREAAALNNPAHIAAARSMAAKSIVLLKNNDNILPLVS